MKVRKAMDAVSLEKILTLYNEAFPEGEQKPFRMLVEKQEEGNVDILYLEEEDEFAGLAIMAAEKDLVLLDYFAIDSRKRNGGAGSRALKALTDYYNGMRMILEIESTKVDCPDHSLRARRKGFYHRNGMTELPFDVSFFGIEMETMSNGTIINGKEYVDLYRNIFGSEVADRVRVL